MCVECSLPNKIYSMDRAAHMKINDLDQQNFTKTWKTNRVPYMPSHECMSLL